MDDYDYILENEDIKNLDSIPSLFNQFYIKRGIHQITYAFDYYLYSQKLWGFHLTSIILHILAALLIWFSYKQLLAVINPENITLSHYSPGFLSALFFAILSINTQPVTYLISRANIVAVLFFMFGFGGSLYVLNRTNYFQRSLQAKIIPFIIINLLLYGSVFLGLGGKEIVITLPFVFVVFVFLVDRFHNNISMCICSRD